MAETTEKTLGDELRAAAARARETFVPAAAARVLHGTRVAICGNHAGNPILVCRGCVYFDTEDPVLARLLVALLNAREPLASWLEKTAEKFDDEVDGRLHDTCDGAIGQDCYCFREALAVARVLNGAAS